MTPRGADEFAASYIASLDSYAALRPRTMQREIGVSDVGYCSAKALFKWTQVPATEAPAGRAALMGTWAHQGLALARKEYDPSLLIEARLQITLPSGLVLVGNADEISPEFDETTDAKTVADEAALIALRRTGSTEQQRYQRHLYHFGAIQAGYCTEAGMVRNVWIDRAGQANWVYVEQEPFDINVVHAADRWLGDVIYAAEHNEEAPRDKHFDHCRAYCEFFSHCRGDQTHGDLIITDGELITAAMLVAEGRAEGKEAKGKEDAGRRALEVLQASAQGDMVSFTAGDFRIRWQRVNAEKPYWKLSLDEVGVT